MALALSRAYAVQRLTAAIGLRAAAKGTGPKRGFDVAQSASACTDGERLRFATSETASRQNLAAIVRAAS